MPFDRPTGARKRIAVIGAGISGMGAAHALATDHHVTLYEAEPRLGGHARTRLAGPNRDTPVDTGFIVFNHANYPNLVRLFDELGVETVPSNMSFGTSFGGGRLEYALHSLDALFAQRRNAVNPKFLRMVRDILHFNKHGLAAARDTTLTVGELISKLGLSTYFRDHYLTPFSGAIWSTPKSRILDFPADALLRFFDNHALLNTHGQHQWYTVAGGSAAASQAVAAAASAGLCNANGFARPRRPCGTPRPRNRAQTVDHSCWRCSPVGTSTMRRLISRKKCAWCAASMPMCAATAASSAPCDTRTVSVQPSSSGALPAASTAATITSASESVRSSAVSGAASGPPAGAASTMSMSACLWVAAGASPRGCECTCATS